MSISQEIQESPLNEWEKYIIWTKPYNTIKKAVGKEGHYSNKYRGYEGVIHCDNYRCHGNYGCKYLYKNNLMSSKRNLCKNLFALKPDHKFFELRPSFPTAPAWKYSLKKLTEIAAEKDFYIEDLETKLEIFSELQKFISDDINFQDLTPERIDINKFLEMNNFDLTIGNKNWIKYKLTKEYPFSLILKNLTSPLHSFNFSDINHVRNFIKILDIEKEQYYEFVREQEFKKEVKIASESFDELMNEVGDGILKP